MEYKIEHLSGVEYKVIVTLDLEKFNKNLDIKATELGKKQNISGFRPGKAPKEAVKKLLGSSLREEVATEMLQKDFGDLAEKEKLNIASMPSISKVTTDDKIVGEVEYSVFPIIELPKSWNKIVVESKEIKESKKDIDDTIEHIRKQSSELKKADKKSEKDDVVVIDYVGSMNGEEFAGGSAKNSEVVVGNSKMIKGFDEALVGVSSGDKKTIKTTFPKEYHAKDLAGKDVEFAITINEVKTHVLPEINKEFFKNAGFKATTEEDFRKEVEHNIKYHTKDLNIKSRKDSIMMQLKKDIEFDLPKGLVNQEAHEMKNNAVNWMMKQNSQMSKEQISSLLQTEQFVKDASSKIQSWLLFDALKKEFDFKIEDKDLEEFLDEQSKRFRDSKEEKEFRDNAISDDKKKENYKSLVLENKIMNKVASLVKIKTKDISYVSAIEKQQ